MAARWVCLMCLCLFGCSGGKPSISGAGATATTTIAADSSPNACPPHRGAGPSRSNSRDATATERTSFLEIMRKSPTGRSIVDQFSVSMADAAAKKQNTTRMSHDPSHGTQISFSATDGRAFLWYPGNAVVLQGTWRACEDRFGFTVKGAETTTIPFGKLCFKYGPTTFNPATGSRGDEWECAAASTFDAKLVEQRAGDVFGLAKRTAVPFVLTREKSTFGQLLARMPKNGKS